MATAAATEFDPALHGFHFRNRFSGLDIVKEINSGFGDVARNVSGSAEFWEGWGLCGGMSWHALDRFYDQEPVPELREVPGQGLRAHPGRQAVPRRPRARHRHRAQAAQTVRAPLPGLDRTAS